jgi:2-iminobutanoate/2-iminopropanoate deaminase
MAKFDVLLSNGAPLPTSAYSQGLAFGDLVVTSGFLGTKPDGTGLISGDFEAELRQALNNVGAVLREAGCSWANVVRINVSLTDIGKFAEMDRIFRDYASPPFPTRSTVGVKELWGNAQVGIDVWAVRPRPS